MNQQRNIDLIINENEAILKNMLLLSKHLSLYDEDNDVVQAASAKLLSGLKAAHAADLPVQINVAKNNFMVLGELLSPNNQLFCKYAYRMFQHGITSFTLTPDLTISSLYRFLRVIASNPDDTWKADGIINLLEQRGIDGIIVSQMSHKDFLLVEGKDQASKKSMRSVADRFWERYARSLISVLPGADLDSLAQSRLDPALLARKLSLLLTGTTGEEQAQFNRALIRCITTTQAHYPKSERLEILIKLAELINHFDDVPKQEIVKELCKLPIPKDFAEDLFNNLSNKVILNAIYQATSGQHYSSPMMLSLIIKLADSRKVVSRYEIDRLSGDEKGFLKKSGELLSNEDLAQYVPAEYQKTLLEVLADQQPPPFLSSELKSLKTTLEDFQIDLQAAQLSLYLLEHGPDKNQMPALYQQIIKSLQFYIDAGDFAGTLALCRSIFTQTDNQNNQFLSDMIPSSLLKQAVTAASYQGKEHKIMLGEIIDLVGSPFISPLVELTISEKNRSNRFFYLSCLKKLGQQVVDAAASYLDNKQWYVVRNMLLLLGELEAQEQLPRIRPLLNHSHSKVRQEALKTCLLLGDTHSIKEIIAGLHSKNRQEALSAILLTKLINHPEVNKHLLARLGEKSLLNFDLELKKNLVQALAEKAHPGALGIFAKILKGRKLLHRREVEQLKIEIIRSLARYPANQAEPLLRQQLNKRNVEAANLARQILQRNQQEKNR